ncbi:hypothetical protein [Prescottella subtropica]|uniref:hypothetical protein n=1 Tax=Prescottella subtropica TaxID=2545757 RepID=UPI0010F567A1|nr:hypothetical protein [Prescottella subtropica]
MTTDVLAALPDDVRMHGLAFRMKSPDSLARKLNDRYEENLNRSIDATAGKITDVVRSTAVTDSDRLVDTARTMTGLLTERGWTVVEVEQSYIDGNQYKGVHMLARHPGGRIAEFQFQFHTEESQKIKDTTHVDYETVCNLDVPVAERAALVEKMTDRWAQLPAPAGLVELTELGGCPVTPKIYTPPKMD